MNPFLVQQYGIVNAKKLRGHAIVKASGFIILRWLLKPAEHEKHTAESAFGLILSRILKALSILSRESCSCHKRATFLRERKNWNVFLRISLKWEVRDFTRIGFIILVLSKRRSGTTNEDQVVFSHINNLERNALISTIRL